MNNTVKHRFGIFIKVWDSIEMKTYKSLHLSFMTRKDCDEFLEKYRDLNFYIKSENN
jgi:hypothetical protein